MKLSHSLFSFAAMACIAIASAAYNSIAHVADTLYVSCRAFKNLLMDNFMSFVVATPGTPDKVPHVQARQYRQRIDKRERPVVTSAWRMCPSV